MGVLRESCCAQAQALSALADAGFSDGVVFLGDTAQHIDDKWRAQAQHCSDVIMAWLVTGDSETDRCCLTREIVEWVTTGKLFVGHEESSWASHLTASVSVARDLPALATSLFKKVKGGVLRQFAEREVPLMIWNTAAWGLWYENLRAVGNRLDGAKVVWTFRVGPGGAFVLFWAVHASIWVESESRHKSNEVRRSPGGGDSKPQIRLFAPNKEFARVREKSNGPEGESLWSRCLVIIPAWRKIGEAPECFVLCFSIVRTATGGDRAAGHRVRAGVHAGRADARHRDHPHQGVSIALPQRLRLRLRASRRLVVQAQRGRVPDCCE